MSKKTPHLLIFGNGYVAKHLALVVANLGWCVSISTRQTPLPATPHKNITFFTFGSALPASATALLSTVPPSNGHDPVLTAYKNQCPGSARWVGYLSSTGVYGDTHGKLVTEQSPLLGATQRAKARIAAEGEWQNLNCPVHIFRLAGIYGPERNMLERLKTGRVHMLEQSNRPVNRIHVADICQTVVKSIRTQKNKTVIYNVADDDPAPTKDVMAYAAHLLNIPIPKDTTLTSSHLMDGSRVVKNGFIKKDLKITWQYPSYKQSLKALMVIRN